MRVCILVYVSVCVEHPGVSVSVSMSVYEAEIAFTGLFDRRSLVFVTGSQILQVGHSVTLHCSRIHLLTLRFGLYARFAVCRRLGLCFAITVRKKNAVLLQICPPGG